MKRETYGEFIRFAVVVTISATINYVIYWVLQHWINVNVAYSIGYVISFFANYYMTAHFTCKEPASAKYGIGLGRASYGQYRLHIILLSSSL